jgi:hypothetical protein
MGAANQATRHRPRGRSAHNQVQELLGMTLIRNSCRKGGDTSDEEEDKRECESSLTK